MGIRLGDPVAPAICSTPAQPPNWLVHPSRSSLKAFSRRGLHRDDIVDRIDDAVTHIRCVLCKAQQETSEHRRQAFIDLDGRYEVVGAAIG